MPAEKLIVSVSARKQIKKLPTKIQTKVVDSFDRLQANPLAGPKLKGELALFFKYRIGDYRIIYEFNPKEKTLVILKIEHRQGVYKELPKRLTIQPNQICILLPVP